MERRSVLKSTFSYHYVRWSAMLITVFLTVYTSVAQSDSTNTQSNHVKKEGWSAHFQFTAVSQSHGSFDAKYSGDNSLSNTAEKGLLTITATAFIGRKLWKGAALYFNPEISGGEGLSGARGIAGFTNGESFRVGDPQPKLYMARGYVRQYIVLRKSRQEYLEDNANLVEDSLPVSCITITAGKFAISDFFDANRYSHDPRSQFLNWSLMSNGAWDYPANTRGYTVGFVAELLQPSFALRASAVQVPKLANGPNLNNKIFKAYGLTMEVEKSWNIHYHTGTIRVLGFRNVTNAVSYRQTLAAAQAGDSSTVPVFKGEKSIDGDMGIKYGFGINADQDINNDIGLFARASWNDGKTGTWAFTEIDRSASAGINVSGKIWKRPADNFGVAAVINGISKDHRAFLKAGLYGFIIGDGNLTYAGEKIMELYYNAQLFDRIFLSADYQFVSCPAYNKDRGPVSIVALRGHIQF